MDCEHPKVTGAKLVTDSKSWPPCAIACSLRALHWISFAPFLAAARARVDGPSLSMQFRENFPNGLCRRRHLELAGPQMVPPAGGRHRRAAWLRGAARHHPRLLSGAAQDHRAALRPHGI